MIFWGGACRVDGAFNVLFRAAATDSPARCFDRTLWEETIAHVWGGVVGRGPKTPQSTWWVGGALALR